jgi:opacity protein-like surface antigen
MKNLTVVLLAVCAVAFAGFADAATPKKKRTRNANRIGPYGAAVIGQSNYTGDQSQNETDLEEILLGAENPVRNISTATEETDLGYQATFGFRFSRYFAAEIGLAQFGSLTSTIRSEMDFGQGFVPTSLKLDFSAGGPIFSAIGILPVNDKLEMFGRAGYMFTSAKRELSSNIDGQRGVFGEGKGDSQDLVLGIGASYNFSQVYSARLEYMKIDGIGEEGRTGTEDLNIIALGLVVRF